MPEALRGRFLDSVGHVLKQIQKAQADIPRWRWTPPSAASRRTLFDCKSHSTRPKILFLFFFPLYRQRPPDRVRQDRVPDRVRHQHIRHSEILRNGTSTSHRTYPTPPNTQSLPLCGFSRRVLTGRWRVLRRGLRSVLFALPRPGFPNRRPRFWRGLLTVSGCS